MTTLTAKGRRRAPASSMLFLLAALALAACSDSTTGPKLAATDDAAFNRGGSPGSPNAPHTERSGAVYTLTNGANGNSVIAFHRATDGSLTRLGSFATGGKGIGGTNDPLFSQYSVILDDDHRSLFAVDAGSNQVTSFHVNPNGSLIRINSLPSRGKTPVSLAMRGSLLYVLNSGDNTLSGFLVIGNALLLPLPHSTRSLAVGADGPAAIHFTRDGRALIVSERASNRFEVLPVQFDGRLGTPVVSAANGGASFGFDVTRHNQPIVSETQGSLTSYALSTQGALTPITASISTGGAAACWVTITENGHFAYTTNAGSNFVAGFAVDASGDLTALNPNGKTGDVGAGATPVDLDHVESQFLYMLESGRGTIGTFAVNADGSLTARADTPAGAPASGFQGLAAY